MASPTLWRRVPLFWRVFAAYMAVLLLVFLLLVFAPITVSIPVALTELLVLAAGLVAASALTLLLLRSAFRPLEEMTATMRRIDLREPGQRVPVTGEPDVAAVAHAFNDMLERLERERRESSRLALAAQEQERQRLARELHDEIGGTFTAIMLQIETLAGRISPERRGDLDALREVARDGATTVREIAVRLRPDALDDLGLARALSALAASIGDHTTIDVDRQIEPIDDLDPDTELVVYRVAQEALTNVARHAGATRVRLTFRRTPDAVRLEICDDGRGLPPSAGDASTGIRGMRERALLVGAHLEIAPADGGGTSVALTVPVETAR